MAQIVVEHEWAEAQPLGRHGHGREDGNRRQLRQEVVVDAEVAVPDRLRRLRATDQGRPIEDAARPDHELEGPHPGIFADVRATNRLVPASDPPPLRWHDRLTGWPSPRRMKL